MTAEREAILDFMGQIGPGGRTLADIVRDEFCVVMVTSEASGHDGYKTGLVMSVRSEDDALAALAFLTGHGLQTYFGTDMVEVVHLADLPPPYTEIMPYPGLYGVRLADSSDPKALKGDDT